MLLKKNVLILHPADKSACAFYRCHAIAMTLNSDKGGEVATLPKLPERWWRKKYPWMKPVCK